MIDMKANRAILVASLLGGLFLSPALAHAAATYDFEATNPTGNNEHFAKGVFEFDQDDKFSSYSIETQFGLNIMGTLFGVEFEFTPQNSSVISSDNGIDRVIDILAPFPGDTSDISSNRTSHFLLAENITVPNSFGTEVDLDYWALTLAFEETIGSSQGEVGIIRGDDFTQGSAMAISTSSGLFTSGSGKINADFKTRNGLTGSVAQGASAEVPVPATLGLLGAGLLGVGLIARRRTRT